jgi:predicted pyridoxine 5'-phosphate oxidase superfamily flavin-nucleotide-binding protein
MTNEAFHLGEQALQARVGLRERLAEIGPLIMRDEMPDPHRAFFAQLPFVMFGSVDTSGQPWASVLAGPPGFAHAPDRRHLRVDSLPMGDDPLCDALNVGAPIGVLGIEPHTRRRNRMNGWIDEVDAQSLSIAVGQSFGNCPKYIVRRQARFAPAAEDAAVESSLRTAYRAATAAVRLDALDAQARLLIASADTFFIATAHPRSGTDDHPSHGVDVSHRGGPAGFVRIDDHRVLKVPDYSGNRFFNTLGNLALNPRAGLLFIDYDSGDLLQLAVTAEIVWTGPEVDALPGAERLVRLRVDRMLRRPAALPLHWGRVQ